MDGLFKLGIRMVYTLRYKSMQLKLTVFLNKFVLMNLAWGKFPE